MRVSACLATAAVAVGLAVPFRAQTRPNFVGKWTLVIEKSTPTTPERHQREITIAQDGRTLTLTQFGYKATGPVVVTSGVSSTPPPREEFQYSITYECDGAEHPTPVVTPPGAPTPPPTLPPGATVTRMTTHTDSTYRAIWTRDQLVIMTRETTTMVTSTSGGTQSQGAPSGATSRKALSIDADGMLVVDSIRLSDPTPNGPTQAAPVPVHSVYRKASERGASWPNF